MAFDVFDWMTGDHPRKTDNGFGHNPQSHLTQRELEHLQKGGTVWHVGRTWYGACGNVTNARLGPFFSAEELAEGERELGASMARMGYRPPHWYECWRWGEYPLSENMRQGYEAVREVEG